MEKARSFYHGFILPTLCRPLSCSAKAGYFPVSKVGCTEQNRTLLHTKGEFLTSTALTTQQGTVFMTSDMNRMRKEDR